MRQLDASASMTTHRLEICFLLILLLAGSLKLPSYRVPHRETDERIYVTLAKQIYTTQSYSLQGTEILESLAPEVYDRPLFFQPPLFPIMAGPLVLALGDNAAVIISWLGHFLVVVAVFLFLRQLLGDRHLSILLVVTMVAFDPVLTFASRKIWVDSLVAGFTALSMYLFWRGCPLALSRQKLVWFGGAGVLFAAAVMTKVPAILAGPFFLILFIEHHRESRLKEVVVPLAASAIPFVLLVSPWFLLNVLRVGAIMDVPSLPPSLLEKSAYLRAARSRPVYYYLQKIVCLTPIVLLPLYHSLRQARKLAAVTLALWTAFFAVIGGYTFFAVAYGQAYVMRYMTLAGAPLYLLVGLYADGRLHRDAAPASPAVSGPGAPLVTWVLCLLTILINAMTSVLYTVMHRFDEMLHTFLGILLRVR